MSDVTPGRRRLGRGLIVTAATLALPLTASISYSVASAQEPVAPVPPLPAEAPLAPLAPIDPDAPPAPPAPEARPIEHRDVRTFVLRHEGEELPGLLAELRLGEELAALAGGAQLLLDPAIEQLGLAPPEDLGQPTDCGGTHGGPPRGDGPGAAWTGKLRPHYGFGNQ